MDLIKNIFLKMYFAIQCIFTVIGYILAIVSVVPICNLIYSSIKEFRLFEFDTIFFEFLFSLLVIASVFCMYFIFTFFSTIASYKLINNEKLTVFQKISYVAFPFITIPLSVLLFICFYGYSGR